MSGQPSIHYLQLSSGESKFLGSLIGQGLSLLEAEGGAGASPDATPADRIAALDAWVKAHPNAGKNDLVAAGALLGEMIRQAMIGRCPLEWRMMLDEYGADLCLQRIGTTAGTFPLSMISKRFERGEADELDLAYIADEISEALANADAAEYPEREQNLYGMNAVDIIATTGDGAVVMIIVASGEITPDPRFRDLLARKVEVAHGYRQSDQFRERDPEKADAPTVIELLVENADLPPAVQAWIDQEAAHCRDLGYTFRVRQADQDGDAGV